MDVSMALALESKRGGMIKGEAKGDRIAIENFTFSAKRPMSTSGARGRTAYTDLTLFKYCDVSTPLILAAIDTNDQVKKAKLFVSKMGSKEELFFSIELFDGVISGFESLGYASSGATTEKFNFPTKEHAIRECITISFARMVVDYYIQNADGSMKQNTSYTLEVRDPNS